MGLFPKKSGVSL